MSCRVLAVSYTHLDVYKRQAFNILSALFMPNDTVTLQVGKVYLLQLSLVIYIFEDPYGDK